MTNRFASRSCCVAAGVQQFSLQIAPHGPLATGTRTLFSLSFSFRRSLVLFSFFIAYVKKGKVICD